MHLFMVKGITCHRTHLRSETKTMFKTNQLRNLLEKLLSCLQKHMNQIGLLLKI